MTFQGIDNQTVELEIINYQFPNSRDRDYDGNWLDIYIKVKSLVGHWQTIDPSLLTWEVQILIDWFLCLADNKEPKYIEKEFIEPNISFYLLNNFEDNEKMIKILFDYECRPKPANDDIEYFVVFKADNIKLQKIAFELIKELKKFPQRN